MIELLKILLSLSLSGTLLMLVLLLCKPLYKNRLSRQWQYYVWLIVVARLLLPFTPETSLVGNLFREVDSAVVQISTNEPTDSRLLPDTDFAEHNTPPKNQVDMTTGESPEIEESLVQRVFETTVQNIWLICVLVWLMVSVGLLIRKATIYQSFVKYIHVGRTEVTDIRLWEQLGKLVEQAGVKRTVELYTNSLITSPLLIGFLHPCIMLPSAELSDSDLKNTILHELTHYKRHDMFYKWLVQVAICFHWFNPVVHLMGKEINRACEFSCDEAVISTFDKGEKRAYGDTLLNALNQGGQYKDSLACVTLNENTEILKERLDAIMNYKKKSRLCIAVSITLIFVMCFGATAVGAYTKSDSKTSERPLQQFEPDDRDKRMDVKSERNKKSMKMETLKIGDKIYYCVENETQLRSIGQGKYSLDKNYIQAADIQLSTKEWIPIGTKKKPFTGSYCGNGCEIIGLTMTDPNAKIIGLFGVADGASIYNITMRDYDIQSAGRNVTGKSVAPILALGLGDTRSYDNQVYPKEK